MHERITAGFGDGEDTGRAAPSAAPVRTGIAGLHHSLIHQVVKVAANGRRCQSEALPQRGRRDRTVFQNEPRHPRAGTGLGPPLRTDGHPGRAGIGAPVYSSFAAHLFHNISVA
ncbi:hypothetical protein GCM10009799_11580 [Nocardiopsis rhodophaea]|uniref:Uncharacterized protein n=1 Tax=Nocardiopsis rhodophaea TaxID=280238 RepID=A0ABN2SJ48_9ACTN